MYKRQPEYRLQTGDLIELYINDEFFPPEGAKSVQKTAPKKQPNQPKEMCIRDRVRRAVGLSKREITSRHQRTDTDQNFLYARQCSP